MVDYRYNLIEIVLLTSQTSTLTTTLLKKHFAQYGLPRVIVSDRGPQEFNLIMTSWGISHFSSSPMHQRVNGKALKAESVVQIMKSMLNKTCKDGDDPYEAILEQKEHPSSGHWLEFSANYVYPQNT